MYTIQDLLPQLLDKVPEIRESYETIRGHSVRNTSSTHSLSIEEVQETQESYQLPAGSFYEPGITIIFEDLLVPFVVALSSDTSYSSRLAEVMDWLEQLASSQVPEVRNLVAVGICEALITNEEEHLKKIQPYMGRGTKGLCRALFPLYHVSENTTRLLKDE